MHDRQITHHPDAQLWIHHHVCYHFCVYVCVRAHAQDRRGARKTIEDGNQRSLCGESLKSYLSRLPPGLALGPCNPGDDRGPKRQWPIVSCTLYNIIYTSLWWCMREDWFLNDFTSNSVWVTFLLMELHGLLLFETIMLLYFMAILVSLSAMFFEELIYASTIIFFSIYYHKCKN